ncbi:gluconokinase [Aquincola sp. S2]|uniref:Gluconokinase n=2 Tax=Pseudaquabacterium terrae TaxID=2732868 RepID=A0ABX2EGC4_9BURK|nr:gluconokinase [Aquabacterium terrae]
MGVAGSGKSTLAAALARALRATLIEGDDHHLPQSQHKMRSGVPLQDADREPWLGRLGDLLAAELGPAVLTCSALKRRYRERLRTAVPALRTVYIDIAPDASRARVAARPGHVFPAGLVTSQFDTLEVPTDEPHVLHLPAQQTPSDQVQAVLQWLAAPLNQRDAP